ncbi:hypothetical protein NDU88_000577 [Pleurodeles waltl]|uniref:Uncharacterized protein n=1 Tax=Pleurodeles waltl TaxID=8319 RepID=A0AAV7RA64_PLEWA|nr:hypothetical protein NDU88_000577 [Pleurodeles waltl]
MAYARHEKRAAPRLAEKTVVRSSTMAGSRASSVVSDWLPVVLPTQWHAVPTSHFRVCSRRRVAVTSSAAGTGPQPRPAVKHGPLWAEPGLEVPEPNSSAVLLLSTGICSSDLLTGKRKCCSNSHVVQSHPKLLPTVTVLQPRVQQILLPTPYCGTAPVDQMLLPTCYCGTALVNQMLPATCYCGTAPDASDAAADTLLWYSPGCIGCCRLHVTVVKHWCIRSCCIYVTVVQRQVHQMLPPTHYCGTALVDQMLLPTRYCGTALVDQMLPPTSYCGTAPDASDAAADTLLWYSPGGSDAAAYMLLWYSPGGSDAAAYMLLWYSPRCIRCCCLQVTAA